MARIFRGACAAVLVIAVLWGTAAAEITLPVNDNNTGVFDQPSTALSGTTVHVAFIGDTTGTGTFLVNYAAVNGGANFANLLLPRDNTVLPIPPFAIDNTGAPGNSPYFDARHPKIALRTAAATEAVILFQARPTAADVVYRPYIARLALSANSAILISVVQVTGFPVGDLATGDIEDISFGIVTTDNTARMAFANKPTTASPTAFQVHFARVGLDNAQVVGTPIQLSSTATGSDGFRPIPSLKLDGQSRAHIAWAAADNTSSAGSIYYALVKETSGADSLAIAATPVLGQALKWGHPSVLVNTDSSIIVLAADERDPTLAGAVGAVELNPDAPAHDQTPADEVASFIVHFAVLEQKANVRRPEAFLDTASTGKRIHITGYGTSQIVDNVVSGTSAVYYAVNLNSLFTTLVFPTEPKQFATSEFPGEIAGDYTKAAFRFLNGKTIVFWSGLVAGSANRNLNVTTVPAVVDVAPSDESGCSMVGDPRAGAAGRVPGAVLLFLPAVALAVRRFSQRIRRLHGSAFAD